MKITTKLLATCTALGLLAIATAAQAGTWTTLEAVITFPDVIMTVAAGVSGNNVVGSYYDSGGYSHGFLYNGTNWITLDAPEQGASETLARGVYGNNVVGSYFGSDGYYHGFLYDDAVWTTLDADLPGASATYAVGIYGDNIVGNYYGSDGPSHGFLYNITDDKWTTLDAEIQEIPDELEVNETFACGIDANNIVGYYTDLSGFPHSFLYNGTTDTWITLNAPPELGATDPIARGIYGDNIVGNYYADDGYSHGFLYDGDTWTTLDTPELGAIGTLASDIDGNYVVGSYYVAPGYSHGYIYTASGSPVPEPATLLGFGIPMLMVGLGKLRGLRK